MSLSPFRYKIVLLSYDNGTATGFSKMFGSWLKLSSDLMAANWEAQRVITLRLAKLSKGGEAANKEARQMVSEKVAASVEAAMNLSSGGTVESVVKRYRSIMRANTRRLSREEK